MIFPHLHCFPTITSNVGRDVLSRWGSNRVRNIIAVTTNAKGCMIMYECSPHILKTDSSWYNSNKEFFYQYESFTSTLLVNGASIFSA